jgi:trimeric autotransporter adhesin
MKIQRLVAAVALATLVAAACDNAMDPQQKDETARIGPADGPSLSVGPTTQVQVLCPAKVQTGTGGQCYAFGLDSLGFYASHTVTAWSSSSISILVVSSSGQLLGQTAGTATIYATVGGVTGSTSVAVRTQTDPTVSIDGTPVAQPGVSCAYTAIPSGGTAPFSYTWSVISGSASGSASGDTWTGSSPTGGTWFTLKVVATDVDGRKASATHQVFVHSGGSCT